MANRIFKISACHEEGESLTKKQLLNDLEKRINEDPEIIEKAKTANKALFIKLQEMVENPDNAEYSGTMILGQISRIPRYSYIKNRDGAAFCMVYIPYAYPIKKNTKKEEKQNKEKNRKRKEPKEKD